ncbi:MAG: ATP-binding cassette domain-containing protein [Rhodospirillaceae bacterium]|nr:ATP-binding cassette domain-containing protein [Rhodospirillaceae bacterium]
MDTSDRIALLGSNSNGKSTLAKIISGRLILINGKLYRSSKLRIGYFAQHQIEELNIEYTAFDHMQSIIQQDSESK